MVSYNVYGGTDNTNDLWRKFRTFDKSIEKVVVEVFVDKV